MPEDSVMVSIAENGLNLGEGLRSFVRLPPRPNYRAMPWGGVLNLLFMASVAILTASRRPAPTAFYGDRAGKNPVK